jgi:hypothetical protein
MRRQPVQATRVSGDAHHGRGDGGGNAEPEPAAARSNNIPQAKVRNRSQAHRRSSDQRVRHRPRDRPAGLPTRRESKSTHTLDMVSPRRDGKIAGTEGERSTSNAWKCAKHHSATSSSGTNIPILCSLTWCPTWTQRFRRRLSMTGHLISLVL